MMMTIKVEKDGCVDILVLNVHTKKKTDN